MDRSVLGQSRQLASEKAMILLVEILCLSSTLGSTFVDLWLIGTDIVSIECNSDAWKMM